MFVFMSSKCQRLFGSVLERFFIIREDVRVFCSYMCAGVFSVFFLLNTNS